jgi:hypothetical protein
MFFQKKYLLLSINWQTKKTVSEFNTLNPLFLFIHIEFADYFLPSKAQIHLLAFYQKITLEIPDNITWNKAANVTFFHIIFLATFY